VLAYFDEEEEVAEHWEHLVEGKSRVVEGPGSVVEFLAQNEGKCITIIDTSILTNYNNDAYIFDTY
jgi:hypothetical protein